MQAKERFAATLAEFRKWLKTPFADTNRDTMFNDICDIPMASYKEKYRDHNFAQCTTWDAIINRYFDVLNASLHPTRQAFYQATKEYNRLDDCLQLGRQTFEKLLKIYG